MGKLSRKLKRRLARELEAREMTNTVPGGLEGALSRGANGSATLHDVSFLARVRAEMRGRNGYTGEDRMSKKRQKDNYTFSVHDSTFHGSSSHSEDGVFKCEEAGEITDTCPLKPKVPSILIPTMMWNTFIQLTKAYDTEWIALLMGKEGKDSKGEAAYIIDKYYFPPQVASRAHVDVPTGTKPRAGTIGAIHSHVGMGVFWSPTDKAHSNWPVEIVINRKAEYKALSRFKLKCGEWAKGDGEVYITGDGLAGVVRKEIDGAFAKGKELAEAAKAARGPSYSPSPYISSYIPPSVSPEDREDVIGALMCVCGHPKSEHFAQGSAGCKKCKPCMKFELEADKSDKATDPPNTLGVIPPLGAKACPFRSLLGHWCMREKEHPGMCRTFQGVYFDPKKEEDSTSSGTSSSSSKEGQGSLGWPPFNELKQLPEKVIDLTIPEGDDPTVGDDEWDCEECGGKGWVQMGNLSKECPKCGGDGMSVKGRDEMAKEMKGL